jgi:hypothetical protein
MNIQYNAAMRFRVFLLRERGRRRPSRDVQVGPSYIGDLQTYYIMNAGAPYQVATLRMGNGMVGKPLPDLYEPVLDAVAPQAMIIRGYERIGEGGGAYTVMQEWRIERVEDVSRGGGDAGATSDR